MKYTLAKTPYVSAGEAVAQVKSGDHIFVQGVAMTPHTLINALCKRADFLQGVSLYHIHTEGQAPYTEPQYANSFKLNAMFVAGNTRKAIQEGYADYIPVFLSEMPTLFRRKILPLDVAFIQVSPPDAHGYCSLGSSVDITLGALEAAKVVIAEVNPHVPRTHGDGFIHFLEIDYAVEVNRPLIEVPPRPISPVDQQIGKYIAEIIEDGATLQMGIGGIPDAVLSQLGDRKRLGIHTEMFSDGLIDLVDRGVVTGEDKRILPGKVVAAFVMGSKRAYDFIDDNPNVVLKEAAFTNDTSLIRQNPNVTAINSAIEIDLTGQVCADTIGPRQFSGVGGQMDFIRGASLSEGGKPIIALGSITRRGESKIVPFLKEGAGITTTRAHVHYVATEYGIVNLYGKTLRQRAQALISIAHPDHRESLQRAAWERFKRM